MKCPISFISLYQINSINFFFLASKLRLPMESNRRVIGWLITVDEVKEVVFCSAAPNYLLNLLTWTLT